MISDNGGAYQKMLGGKALFIGRVLTHAISRHDWKWMLHCVVDAQLKAGLASAHLKPVVDGYCEYHKLLLRSCMVRIHGPVAVLACLRCVAAQAHTVSDRVK